MKMGAYALEVKVRRGMRIAGGEREWTDGPERTERKGDIRRC